MKRIIHKFIYNNASIKENKIKMSKFIDAK